MKFNLISDGLDSGRPSGGGGDGGGGESLEMLGVEPDQSDELNRGSNIVTTDLNIM